MRVLVEMTSASQCSILSMPPPKLIAGVIPPDCWQEPYMRSDELEAEIAAGVVFWGYQVDGTLAGVMRLQSVRDVDLVRHAYVLPSNQRPRYWRCTDCASPRDKQAA